MTQEEKQLLFKDLCTRLPYRVKVWNSEFLDPIEEYHPNEILILSDLDYYIKESIEVKPYLRPMSSMTKEEKAEAMTLNFIDMFGYIDWLNAHHFDYHGLIEKGLALEAPADIYKTE